MGFHRVRPLELATGYAAFVLACNTDQFVFHPEFKVRLFEEFLNKNYAGIRRIPPQGGKRVTHRRGLEDQ